MSIANILLVDDEAAFVEAMSKIPEKKDFKIFKALSGKDALRQMENSCIDIVILDVKMPDMNGIETLKEIKKYYPFTEVILLTGNDILDTGIDGMKLGAFDYLMKPCDTDVLLKKVNEAAVYKRENEIKPLL